MQKHVYRRTSNVVLGRAELWIANEKSPSDRPGLMLGNPGTGVSGIQSPHFGKFALRGRKKRMRLVENEKIILEIRIDICYTHFVP